MGYDLVALNEEVKEDFHFGIFSWPIMLEECTGTYFSVIQNKGQWYHALGIDPRMGDNYPQLISNDGFEVTEEEAKVLARMCCNYVAIQRSLPDPSGKPEDNWPRKIRGDFVDLFESFAEWAKRSGGFKIY